MQIVNASPGVRAIRSLNLKLKPGDIATVNDADWKKARAKPVVAGWLETGDLRELSASDANKLKDKDGDGKPDAGKK